MMPIGAMLAIDADTEVKLVFHSQELMEEHKSDWDELWESANVEHKKHYEVFT